MLLDDIRTVIRKNNFFLSENQIEELALECENAVQNESYQFDKYTKSVLSKNGKKRLIYSFPKDSVENILCHYLKKKLDKAFHLKYASRNKIINLLFNTLVATKNMNDFVIVRADFKSFYDSVYSKYVFERYILPSLLKRGDKQVLEKYISEIKYCYAGLCLSNCMTEIVCKDFDVVLKARLSEYGVFFYERYVDDIIIMFNNFILEEKIKNIIKETINDIFGRCPVRLSNDSGKFTYISKRHISNKQSFNYLGYEFFILKDSNDKIKFNYGITKQKREKYSNIVERAFINYKKEKNEELLRQQLKVFSSRVVISRQILGSSLDWLTKGVVANYNELKNYTNQLDDETMEYLKYLFYQLLEKHKIKRPYFISKKQSSDNSMYNLYSNMKSNKTLLFDENIGIQKEVLLKWIHRIDGSYTNINSDYYRIAMDYLELIKIN